MTEIEWEPLGPPPRNPTPADPMNPEADAKATPCATCPFRTANVGRITGRGEEWDQYFRPATHEAVWVGTWDPEHPESALRNGGLNHCHMTHAHACAGALALQHRELLRFAARRRYDLSRMGVERVAGRMGFAERLLANVPRFWRPERVPFGLARSLSVAEVLEVAHPAITDPAVGVEILPGPSRAEQRMWRRSPQAERVAVDAVTLDEPIEDDERTLTFAIRHNGRVVGRCLLGRASARVAMLEAYIDAERDRGRGIGQAAAAEGVRYAFEELGVRSVCVDIARRNVAAIRGAEAVGFVRHDAGVLDPSLAGRVLMRLPRSTWRAARGGPAVSWHRPTRRRVRRLRGIRGGG